MKTLHNTAITTIIVALSVSTPVFSQENTENSEATGKKSLSVGIGFPDHFQEFQSKIGLAIGPFPEYEGSDKYGASAMPLIVIRKPGVYFLKGASIDTNDGLASVGLTLFHLSYSEESGRRIQIVMGPLIRAYGGREESNSDILNGMGDIDRSVGIGGFIEFSAGVWQANLSVSPQEVGNDNDGTLATFDIEYITSIKDGLKISTGLSTSWADA